MVIMSNVIEKDIITGYYIAIRFIMFIILILGSFKNKFCSNVGSSFRA